MYSFFNRFACPLLKVKTSNVFFFFRSNLCFPPVDRDFLMDYNYAIDYMIYGEYVLFLKKREKALVKIQYIFGEVLEIFLFYWFYGPNYFLLWWQISVSRRNMFCLFRRLCFNWTFSERNHSIKIIDGEICLQWIK